MADGASDIDRLRAAIEAHERFVAEGGHRSASDFLAEHADLGDLLLPLLHERTRAAPLENATNARVLDDFRLLRELGRGGMGVVYEAEQISLGRRVAVKILPAHLAGDPDRRARFVRESRLAASLDHPGIAKVISAHADDDLLWFAMECIDGAPLDRVLSRVTDTRAALMTSRVLESVVHEVTGRRGDTAAGVLGDQRRPRMTWGASHVETVVGIGVQIADALQHAHVHGVVHRDVKPANIVLRGDGTAVLTDFGLARELGGSALTITGDFLGTPSYSAPEQLTGNRATLDHRADIFALGVTLYELLTHRRPFEASTTDEIRTRILSDEPQRPARVNRQIPADLSSVLLMALEKDPNRRYQTAAAMAADLRAVVARRPVRARPVRVPARAWRWARRNPWAATALTALFGMVILLGSAIVVFDQMRTERALRAGVALARAKDFRGAWAELMLLDQERPAVAAVALEELFRRYPCLTSQPLVRGHDERVRRADFSADGRWLLTTHQQWRVPEGQRWYLRLWAVPTPSTPELESLWQSAPCANEPQAEHVAPAGTVAWTEQDNRVFVAGPNHATEQIEFAENVQEVFPASVPGCFGVRLHSRILLCRSDGSIVSQWPGRPVKGIWGLGDSLVTAHTSVSGWDLFYTRPQAASVKFATAVTYPRIDLDPHYPERIIVTTDDQIRAWRTEAGVLVAAWPPRQNRLPSWLWLHGAPDSSRIEHLVHESRLRELDQLPLRRPDVCAARLFVGDAEMGAHQPFVVAAEERMLRLWGMPEPRQLGPERGELELVRFEPGSQRVWSVGDSGTPDAWSFAADATGSRPDIQLPSQLQDRLAQAATPHFAGLAFDPGRAVFACARYLVDGVDPPGWVVLLPVGNPERAQAYPCRSIPNWLAISPDRRHLAIAESDGGIEWWAYDSARLRLHDPLALPRTTVEATRLSCLAYFDDRFLLAAAGATSGNGGILRWDLREPEAEPESIAPFDARAPVRCLAVATDRTLVATGSDDRFVRLMRVIWRDGQPGLQRCWEMPHGAPVFAVALTERGGEPILASADRSGAIQLWDAKTGRSRGCVRDPSTDATQMILSLDFSPDGRHLVAAQHDGRVLVWDMERPRRCLEGNRTGAAVLLPLRGDSR
ncbi:MAG: serine/threonine-protein kinase [Planctomycetota bacterium]